MGVWGGVAYPNGKYNGALAYKQIGLDFDPRLGFANRRGIHDFSGRLRRRRRPNGYLRTVDVQLAGGAVVDSDFDVDRSSAASSVLQRNPRSTSRCFVLIRSTAWTLRNCPRFQCSRT